MAYLCGYVTDREKEELERRGWEIEEAPAELTPKAPPPDGESQYVMVWVDNDLFSIMNGPDWEKG